MSEFEKKIIAWANIHASKREDGGSKKLQMKLIRDEAKRRAAGADKRVNEFPQYEREGLITMMFMPYNWIWQNECTREGWREGEEVNLPPSEKKNKGDPGH